jgi:hypothetical protein
MKKYSIELRITEGSKITDATDVSDYFSSDSLPRIGEIIQIKGMRTRISMVEYILHEFTDIIIHAEYEEYTK